MTGRTNNSTNRNDGYNGKTRKNAHNVKKHYRIKSRFRFYSFVIVMTILLSFSVSTIFGNSTAKAVSPDEYVSVTVEVGDTLWNIAREYGPSGTDTRIIVYNIERLNNVKAETLVPGQVLLVPIS